jgi:hypothetical protein
VPSDRSDGAIEFLMASPSQLDDVVTILDEAARWLQARGVSQWPSRFELSWVEGAIGRGETWLARVPARPSRWTWPTPSGTGSLAALFTCTGWRCAVYRRRILAWAAGAVRERGLEALRLDCVASNDRLRAYYEAAGFIHRGDVTVAGGSGPANPAEP